MAVRFSATGQAYESGVGASISPPVTILCWGMIVTDRNAFSTFVDLDNNTTTNTLILGTDTDGTTLNAYSDPGAHVAVGPNMTVGTWYKMAVVVSGGTGTLYSAALGSALSSAAMSGTITATGLTVVSIGDSPAVGEFLNGRVANTKVYSAALTVDEIEAELSQYTPVRTANLEFWSPFLAAGTTDYSGNARTLTGGTGATTEDGPPIPWAEPHPAVVLPELFTAAVTASTTAAVSSTAVTGGAVSAATTAAVTATAGVPANVAATTTAAATTQAGYVADVSAATVASASVLGAAAALASATTTAGASGTANKTDTTGATRSTTAAAAVVGNRADTGGATHATTAAITTAARVIVTISPAPTVASAAVTATQTRPDFGEIRIGRLLLTESWKSASEQWTSGTRVLSISGQESAPPLTESAINALHDDLLNLQDSLVQAQFTYKADRDGYYQVNDVSVDLVNWGDQAITCDWKLTLARAGSDSEVDIESRLSGPQTRTNNFSIVGNRWHAPPIGHTGYWTGATAPSRLTRASQDGDITIYRGVPVGESARYACPVNSYRAGRVRVLDRDRERVGVQWKTSTSDWEISNGLVRAAIDPDATLYVASWTPVSGIFPGEDTFPGEGTFPGGSGGVWSAKGWDLLIGGAAVGRPAGCSVLRNDFEVGIVRVLWAGSPTGRTTADLTLRRGSRMLEVFVRTAYSSTIKLVRATAEAGTSGTGFVRATSNDAAGNRYVVASARTFTADVINGGISKTSTTSMDAFISAEAGGSSAISGDQAAQLGQQYIGACSELVTITRR